MIPSDQATRRPGAKSVDNRATGITSAHRDCSEAIQMCFVRIAGARAILQTTARRKVSLFEVIVMNREERIGRRDDHRRGFPQIYKGTGERKGVKG